MLSRPEKRRRRTGIDTSSNRHQTKKHKLNLRALFSLPKRRELSLIRHNEFETDEGWMRRLYESLLAHHSSIDSRQPSASSSLRETQHELSRPEAKVFPSAVCSQAQVLPRFFDLLFTITSATLQSTTHNFGSCSSFNMSNCESSFPNCNAVEYESGE